MLRRAELVLGIGINAGAAAGQIPNAGGPELTGNFAVLHPGDKYFGALIRKLIIELATQEDAKIVRRQLQVELGNTGGLAASVGVSGVDFFPVQAIHTPLISGRNFA